ncbi:hypothetical protein RZN22_08285 [Bacillaceae bacterium S4-13-58]
MGCNQQISEEKLIDFVLEKLSPEEMKWVQSHSRECTTCHTQIRMWRNVFHKEVQADHELIPSSSVKKRIFNSIEKRRLPKRKLFSVKNLSVSVGLVASVIIFFSLLSLPNKVETPPYVVLHNEEIQENNNLWNNNDTNQMEIIPVSTDTPIRGDAWINDKMNEMLLEVHGLSTFRTADYQLWVIDINNDLKGEILYVQDGSSRILLKGINTNMLKQIRASIEPLGGSPAPTGPEAFYVSFE